MNLPCPACGRLLDSPTPVPDSAQCPYCEFIFNAVELVDQLSRTWVPSPYARAAVRWPGTALVIAGVLGVLISLILAASSFFFMVWVKNGGTLPEIFEAQWGEKLVSELKDPQLQMYRLMMSLAMLLDSIILVVGAVHLLSLRSYRWALAGIICAMMPCLQNLFFLTLPIGMWALIVVNRPGVWRAFRSNQERRIPHA